MIPTAQQVTDWIRVLVLVGTAAIVCVWFYIAVELIAHGIASWWYHLTPKDQQRDMLAKASGAWRSQGGK